MAFSSLWLSLVSYSGFGWNAKTDGDNGFPARNETARITKKKDGKIE